MATILLILNVLVYEQYIAEYYDSAYIMHTLFNDIISP